MDGFNDFNFDIQCDDHDCATLFTSAFNMQDILDMPADQPLWPAWDIPESSAITTDTAVGIECKPPRLPIAAQNRILEIYQEIEISETEIRECEIQTGTRQDLLGLKLRKTQLWLELNRLRDGANSKKSKDFVALEYEEATLQLELLESHRAPEQLDEDLEYLQLKVRRVQLKRDLDNLRQFPSETTTPSTGNEQQQQQQVS
jgi:hypothetical protein